MERKIHLEQVFLLAVHFHSLCQKPHVNVYIQTEVTSCKEKDVSLAELSPGGTSHLARPRLQSCQSKSMLVEAGYPL